MASEDTSRIALITGGSRGIGRALVHRFVAEGFHVFTCARKKEGLDRLREEIRTTYPVAKLDTHAIDLSRPEERNTWVSMLTKRFSTPDVLIHNAGIFLGGRLQDEEEGILERLMETNVYSAYGLTRAFLANMKARRRGHIFTLCSVASLQAYPNGASYCMSKFALLGFTKVLREELKSYGIRVTAVLLGATLTDSWISSGLPPDRFIRPEDAAHAVWDAYTLSKQAVVEELLLRPQEGDV